jgi:thymidine phosphorylase
MNKRILGGRLLLLTNRVQTIEQGREMIRQSFENGTALKKFYEMIVGQGVSKTIAEQLISRNDEHVQAILKLADEQYRAVSLSNGFIQSIDSFKLGTIVQRLGTYRSSYDNTNVSSSFLFLSFKVVVD